MNKYSAYIGKTVLVGVSVFSESNELLSEYQFFGKIISIDNVISIRKENGEIETLPPNVDNLQKASQGIYTLKCNGEKVENPDFVSTWSVYKPE